MTITLLTKRSTTGGTAPTTAQLAVGELGLNTEDAYLYAKNNAGSAVKRIGTTADRVAFTPESAADVVTDLQTAVRLLQKQNKYFPTISAMLTDPTLLNGDVCYVAVGTPGKPEEFQIVPFASYAASSSPLVQATSVVDGTGHLWAKSTRTAYLSAAEAKGDPRTFSAGTIATILSIGAIYSAVASGGNLGQTNAGGQSWDVVYGDLRAWWTAGDGTTNDTAPVANAVSYINTTGKNVVVPYGTYLTDAFTIYGTSYGTQGCFTGLDREKCIFKRNTAGTGAFVTIGSSAATIFQSGLQMVNLTIDGGATTNGPAFLSYDLVRSRIANVNFQGGSYSANMKGGIAVTFDSCLFQGATIGFRAENFTSSAGGGYPNLIKLRNCKVVSNSTWGVWFDGGRQLQLDACDVEGNGTTLGAAQGGLYVGANVGTEVSASDALTQGVVVKNCWFEANLGTADVELNSGLNYIDDSSFFSTAAQTTNDIIVNGGRYKISGLNSSFSKTANLLEGAGVTSGNLIQFCKIPNLSYNATKTSVISGDYFNLGNGRVPTVAGRLKPLVQEGSDSSGVNPTITFPIAFGSVPEIQCQIVNNSSATIDQVEIYNITATGFTMRKKSFNGTTIGTVNYTVYWQAIGED